MMYRTAGLIDAMIKLPDEAGLDIGRTTANALREYMIECSIMKIFGSEIQGFVADESVQIFGGYGYIYENPAELAYRNARINRIWEGTNEINRIIIAHTLMKRFAGRKIERAADLAELVPVKEDDPDTLDAQEGILMLAKTVAGFCLGSAADRYKGDLRDHQELAGIISDMMIEIYAYESAYLRACKMGMEKKHRSEDIARCIVKVLSIRLLDRMRMLLGRAMPVLIEAASVLETTSAVGSLLTPPPVDTIALNRQIADHCVQKKGYPFKGV